MKNKLSLALACLALITLNGCGIKGPLYMPKHTEVTQQIDQENISLNTQKATEQN